MACGVYILEKKKKLISKLKMADEEQYEIFQILTYPIIIKV